MIQETRKTKLAAALFASLLGVTATPILAPSLCYAQEQAASEQKVRTAMQLLKSKSENLGPAKIEGKSTVGGQNVPAIYFGGTKMNDNFALVDEVQKQAGGTATIFVKNGDQFVRVATNVRKDDGSRATGTILDPNGKVIQAIRTNQPYYGEADLLGKAYVTAYEPIRDQDANVIGIYYVGYLKGQL